MAPGYRKGVLAGNYVEHLAAKDASSSEPPRTFESTTTAATAFSDQGKTGDQLLAASSREDVRLKYGKYGKTARLGDSSGGYYATMSQLAFSKPSPGAAGVNGAGDSSGRQEGDGTVKVQKVQQFIWKGSKAADSEVPTTVTVNKMAEERQKELGIAASRSQFLTVEKEMLKQAAEAKELREAAKPAACRPKAEGGQEAQVGRKADGEFVRALNKDFLRIGLRK